MPEGLTTARPAERRTQMRLPCADPGSLRVLASLGQDLWQAPVCDISVGGIGIVLNRRVDPGTLLAIELLNKSQHFWHLKLLRVVHATQRDSEGWLVGSAFLKVFTDDELRALLQLPQ